MTNHSPQANCLAIVQNFSNFWGDCLNLTLLIKKGVLSTFQIFIVIREGGWGGIIGRGNSHCFLKIS